jgi:hypothetical protein
MLLSSGMIMIRCNWLAVMRRVAFLLILSSLMFVRTGDAAPPVHDDTTGGYRVVFKGCYTGTGKATVTPKSVMIKAELVDEKGNSVDFTVQKIPVENHRFFDDVTIGGATISIAGRVDPSGGPLHKARITFTFGAQSVGYGRATGEHN